MARRSSLNDGLRGVFVTGTGTEVGKTVVAAAIARGAASAGLRPAAFKPAVTGLDDPGEPDHELLRRAAGSAQSDDGIAPYRFGPPASPHLAAEMAGERIEPQRLIEGAQSAADAGDFLVCEGVGGLLVPLDADYSVRDFARELGMPLVVAASPGLGTINHTLLTLEAARAAGLDVACVVLTPWPPDPGEIERSNRQTLDEVGGAPVAVLPQLDLERPESWPSLRESLADLLPGRSSPSA